MDKIEGHSGHMEKVKGQGEGPVHVPEPSMPRAVIQ